jgi:hypothetical protein
MSCNSFVLILEWAVQTCSTSYLLRSNSLRRDGTMRLGYSINRPERICRTPPFQSVINLTNPARRIPP